MAFTIKGDSAEAVAFGLMHTVLQAQGKSTSNDVSSGDISERELLALYARCVNVVRNGFADEPHLYEQGGYVATMND